MKKTVPFIIVLLICAAVFWFKDDQLANRPFPFWGFSVEGFPISKNQLGQLYQDTQINAQVIQFYLQWPSPETKKFEPLQSTLQAISDSGATPCITWEPMHVFENQESMIPFELILDGTYESYLNFMAGEIKFWKKPIIIRFAHEMNLQRYHWGTDEEEFSERSPEIYIKMFRYLVTYFQKKQVENVFWAFCPNVDSVPNLAWNQPKNYYPGDQYVDLLGMDGYNFAISSEIAQARQLNWTKPWLSFKQIFQGLYQELKKIAPKKPIVVFETASPVRVGQNQTKWLQEALHTAKQWGLCGVIWFQINKEEDWRLQDPASILFIQDLTQKETDCLHVIP